MDTNLAIVLGFVFGLSFGSVISYFVALQDIEMTQNEAIKRGYGTIVIGNDGKRKFRWIEKEKQ